MTPWIVAHHVSLFMGFLRQEYWRGFSFPLPGHLQERGIKSASPARGFFTTEPHGNPKYIHTCIHKFLKFVLSHRFGACPIQETNQAY